MRTAPPTVPGMLTPNSMPDSPARAARAATAGRRAPRRTASAAAARSRSLPARGRASRPGRARRRRRSAGSSPSRRRSPPGPRRPAHASSSSSCDSLPARAKYSPAPPVRTVVRRASAIVALDPGRRAHRLTSARPSASTSPAPITTHRSSCASTPCSTRSASAKRGAQYTGLPAAASALARASRGR